VLQEIITPSINVITIEDPVEYRIPSITQIQVNEEQDLTFARGLRAIVRQDPDVILVGEIRDHETAQITINAALTGHLVLSTLHANDSSTAIPRLLEMGVEPFLLSSTLELVIAQRLVRKLCNHCKEPLKKASERIAEVLAMTTDIDQQKLFVPVGCGHCGGTGYKGRLALFEILPITAAIRENILKKPSAADVWSMAAEEGATSLFQSGMRRAEQGLTSVDEVLRVAQPD
jgi:type II secretory ATPase GspE/PulE/Tfp pilus assembly ATPase PilB-like protein